MLQDTIVAVVPWYNDCEWGVKEGNKSGGPNMKETLCYLLGNFHLAVTQGPQELMATSLPSMTI